MKLRINKQKLRVLEPTRNPFQSLARSIIYQQLSGRAADAILKKFIALTPRKQFPTPIDVLKLTDAQFKSAGVSAQKASYVRSLAQHFVENKITIATFHKMRDQEIIEYLTTIKGIGVWTAHMFLIFALNRPNILPIGDLAIKKGFQKAFNLRNIPNEKVMKRLAIPHDGEHTYLALHLWGLMDEEKK